jgi:hypothetical protein
MSDQSEASLKFISNENSPDVPKKQSTASMAVNKGNSNKIHHSKSTSKSRGTTKKYQQRSHNKYMAYSSEDVAYTSKSRGTTKNLNQDHIINIWQIYRKIHLKMSHPKDL